MAISIGNYLESLFGTRARLRTSAISGGIIFLVEVMLLLASGFIEGTFWLPGDGVGVLENALWVMILGDWMLLILIFFLAKHLWNIASEFPMEKNDSSINYLLGIQKEISDRLFLRGPPRNWSILIVFCGAGLFFFLYNFVRMNNPDAYFHFPMFNTSDQPVGFWTGRFILFTSWVVLIPYLAYVCLTTLVIVRRIISAGSECPKYNLRYNYGHPDKHGGFTYLSKLNILFSLGLFILFVELIAEISTFPIITLPVRIMLPLVTAIFIWMTFWFMKPVENFMKKAKNDADQLLKNVSFDIKSHDQKSANFLIKYNHIKSNLNFTLNTFWSNAILSGIRLASIMGTAYKFIGAPSF